MLVIAVPSNRISPRVTSTSPEMALISVDLPAPLGPTTATSSPGRTSSDTSQSATTSP